MSLKRSLCYGMVCLALACVGVKSAFAQQSNGKFIKNSLSGKCIDVARAPGDSNGSKLQLWDCESSGRNRDNGSITDQQWQLTSDGFIKNTLSGKCIDVSGAPGSANGSPLLLWDCETTGFNRDNGSPTDQQWELTSDGFIRNLSSGKCIDVAGAPGQTNGAALQLWDCETSGRNSDNGSATDQKWSFVDLATSNANLLSPETSSEIRGGKGPTSMGGGWAEASATFYRNGLLVVEGHSRSDSRTSGTYAQIFVVGVDSRGRSLFVSNLFDMPTACSLLDTCSSERRTNFQQRINSDLAQYIARVDVYVADRSGGRSAREAFRVTITESCAAYDDLPVAARAAIAAETGFAGCNP